MLQVVTPQPIDQEQNKENAMFMVENENGTVYNLDACYKWKIVDSTHIAVYFPGEDQPLILEKNEQVINHLTKRVIKVRTAHPNYEV